jgi:hypothetical protein
MLLSEITNSSAATGTLISFVGLVMIDTQLVLREESGLEA